jgi:ankyrin repeat protein
MLPVVHNEDLQGAFSMRRLIFNILLVFLFLITLSCAEVSKKGEALPFTKFMFLVGQGQVEAVREAIRKGQNLSQANEQRVTALMLASFKGNLEIAELLIHSGAQVNFLDQQGRSALFYAIDGQKNELVQLLLRSKAQVNLKDSYNLTPLMVAASQGSVYLTGLLLEAGAKAEIMDEQGWDALFYAVAVQSQPATEKLLKAGSPINRADIDGNTLAHLCVQRNNLELLQFLVSRGMNLQLKNRMGMTPQEVAFQNLNFKMSDYFEGLKQREAKQITQ